MSCTRSAIAIAAGVALAACASRSERSTPASPDENGNLARPAECVPVEIHRQEVPDRGSVAVWRDGAAVGFTSHMEVDADGAPDAYRPDRSGLSYICDGAVAFDGERCVFPEGNPDWQTRCNEAYRRAVASDWAGEPMCVFGWRMAGGRQIGGATVGGRPILQRAGDPAPGNFVSTTTLVVPDAPADTQRAYVNSRTIPFIALSSKIMSVSGASIGAKSSLALAWRRSTGALAFAVVADRGPGWQIGEGSIALHRALGSDPIVKIAGVDRAKHGIEDEIAYLVFPDARIAARMDEAAFQREISMKGAAAFADWGGFDRLVDCAGR